MDKEYHTEDESLRKLWDASGEGFPKEKTDEALRKVSSRILKEEGERSRRRWLRYAGIAASFLVPVVSIALSLLYVSGARKNVKDMEMLECFVPEGEIRQISLEDGSVLSLKGGSTLIYPSHFSGNERTVYLSGESACEIAKDPEKPFKIKTRDIDVEVLGTIFDISAYSDNEEVSVALYQGRVKVSSTSGEALLKENQMASFSRLDSSMVVSNVNASEYLAWKDGAVIFNDASIREIISTIERTYGVHVTYTSSPQYEKARITAKFYERQSLPELLDFLSGLIPGMKFSCEDKEVALY
jgi:ferric-dicitrate binding protein FerR (iron transport regulator)